MISKDISTGCFYEKKNCFVILAQFTFLLSEKFFSLFAQNLEVSGIFSKRNGNYKTKFLYHFVACIG